MKHITPGPWRKQGNLILGKDFGTSVAKLFAIGHQQEAANASLIAAAPELLEACKKAEAAIYRLTKEAGLPDSIESERELRDAIAKAEGRD